MSKILSSEMFTKKFNERIFQNYKYKLLKKIAEEPHRYVGDFRPTKTKIKIIQNITHSHEIKFGDALEDIIQIYFKNQGYTLLNKTIQCEDGKYCVDQLVEKDNKIFFIEQKIRDDHDSSKIRGQINNFEKKLELLKKKYSEKEIEAYFYFIDFSLNKCKKYYCIELQRIEQKYGIKCNLCYGSELFNLMEIPLIWTELEENLIEWRKNLPEFPEINFDFDASKSFEEIKELPASCWKKLLNNEKITNEVFPVIFPKKATLILLYDYYEKKHEEKPKHKTYANICENLKLILDK